MHSINDLLSAYASLGLSRGQLNVWIQRGHVTIADMPGTGKTRKVSSLEALTIGALLLLVRSGEQPRLAALLAPVIGNHARRSRTATPHGQVVLVYWWDDGSPRYRVEQSGALSLGGMKFKCPRVCMIDQWAAELADRLRETSARG